MTSQAIEGFSLSHQQDRLWRLQAEGRLMQTRSRICVEGPVDVGRLKASVVDVVNRQEILRTVFRSLPGMDVPVQVILDEARCEFVQGGESKRGSLEPIDLEQGPLVRCLVTSIAPNRHVLEIVTPALCADLWTHRNLAREIVLCYEGQSEQVEAIQYVDFAQWQSELLNSDEAQRGQDYWRRTVDRESLGRTLSQKRRDPAPPSAAVSAVRREIPVPLSSRARTWVRERNTTLEALCLAAWQVLVRRHLDFQEVTIGRFHAGRKYEELARAHGLYGQYLPVRSRGRVSHTFAEAVAEAERMVAETEEWEEYFSWAAFGAQEVPDAERTLLCFPIGFEHRDMKERWTAGDIQFTWQGLGAELDRFELHLAVLVGSETIELELRYDVPAFREKDVTRLVERFMVLLEDGVSHPDRPVGDLRLLSSEDQEILDRLHGEPQALEGPVSFPRAFEIQARRSPDASALKIGSEERTYSALDRRSNQWARFLAHRGVGWGSFVILALERSVEQMEALLATTKLGATFVPIDPFQPKARLRHMLGDVLAQDPQALVLTVEGLVPKLPANSVETRLVCLDAHAEGVERESDKPLGIEVDGDTPMYVIFTSGSRGRPKGVVVRHRSVLNLMQALAQTVYEGTEDASPLRVSLNAPLTFDASIKQLVQWLQGHELLVVPEGIRADGQALCEWLLENSVDVLDSTPSQLHLVLQAGWVDGEETTLRRILVGGEAIGEDVWNMLQELPGAFNVYGPTECTVDVTLHRIADSKTPSIGRSLSNVYTHVVGQRLQLVPPGVAGELCVAGMGLAVGYLASPRKTAAAFLPNPFATVPGDRLYRTGDRVRLLEDDGFEFLGRLDDQVKIRGFRVELGEIEAVLREHPDVVEAAAMVREDTPGQTRLVAYVVLRAGIAYEPREEDDGDFREFLKERLPEPMVPAPVIPLDKMPLTRNGKVDRQALPAPESIEHLRDRVLKAPGTTFEEILVGIFSGALQVDSMGVDESFFDRGGHSLLATQLVSRIRQIFDVELPLRILFEEPTVEGLARRLEMEVEQRRETSKPPLRQVERKDQILELSFTQQRLWFLQQLSPDSHAYNSPKSIVVSGDLNFQGVSDALGEMVRRHEILRTKFPERQSGPVQEILPTTRLALPVVDLSNLADRLRDQEAEELATLEARRCFDLTSHVPLRTRVLRLEARQHHVLWTLHHIAVDEWSLGLMMLEVSQMYRSFVEGKPSPLPEPAVQYADFAQWQRGWLQGDFLARELAWWRDRLGDVPPLELPTDRPRPPVRSSVGQRRMVELPHEVLEQARTLGRSQAATLFMVLLAGYRALLGRYAGQDDFAVAFPVAGRLTIEVESLLGCFINTLVVRLPASSEATFAELLTQVRERTLDVLAHQELPFEKLIEEMQVERNSDRPPLSQVMLTLQTSEERLELGDLLTVRSSEIDKETAKFDLTVFLHEPTRRLSVVFDRDLFDSTTMERFLRHFRTLLAGALESPGSRLSELPILGTAQRSQLLVEWNDTARGKVPEACLHESFASRVTERPDVVAVVYEGHHVSFSELNRRSNLLARDLRSRGVGPEVPVALYMERSLEIVVAIFGVLKAGGVYVPLALNLPPERLAEVVRQAGAGTLLTQARLQEGLDLDQVSVIALDGDVPTWESPEPGKPEPGVSVGGSAYWIYTSGSTGLPKGVMVEHRQVQDHLAALWCRLSLEDGMRYALVQPLAFDASKSTLYTPLLRGGCLHVISEERATDPEGLSRYLEREGIDYLKITPSHLSALVRSATRPERLLPRRWLVVGGEALHREWAEGLVSLRPGLGLYNNYGPTETTVSTSKYRVGEGRLPEHVTILPLGRPLAETRYYLLDRDLHPVPIGVSGEVLIGGRGVTRGYFSRPALTAERYVPDPFGDHAGERLYRSGDLGRYRADGQVEFLGRVDHQVKVRGFRVELDEVRGALSRNSQVHAAVVVVREAPTGDPRLVAYVVPESGSALESRRLREYAADRLPDYMVPSMYVVLDRLPRNANGKVDREALPEPDFSEVGRAPYRAPRTEVERILAGIWGEVLGLESVGLDEDFFELGGHSLLATQVVTRARQVFDVEIPLRDHFEAPTVAELAQRVRALLGQDRGLATPPMALVSREQALPLSFAQQRLWFLHQLEPDSPYYNIAGALRLEGSLGVRLLGEVFTEIVRRHEVLRTSYDTTNGQPVQVIHAPSPLTPPMADLQRLTEEDRQRESRKLAYLEARRVFDLSRDRSIRVSTLRLASDVHVILLTLHHIAGDGWSLSILTREVNTLHQSFSRGCPSSLNELSIQYADFAHWQRQWLQGDLLERHLRYWKQAITGDLPSLRFSEATGTPEAPRTQGQRVTLRLPADVSTAVLELSQREGTTPFMTLLSVFAILLSRHTETRELLIGMPLANRTRSESENLIGFFINVLPILVDLREPVPFLSLLQRVRASTLDAFMHQELPLEEVVKEVRPDRSSDGSPLYQVTFGVQNAPTERFETEDFQLEALRFDSETARFDLTVWAREADDESGEIILRWRFRTAVFSEQDIRRMHEHFEQLVRSVVADPNREIDELEMRTKAEKRKQDLREQSREKSMHERLLRARPKQVKVETPGDESNP